VVGSWSLWSEGEEKVAGAASTTSTSTRTPSTGTPEWHRGIIAAVFLTAITAATRATARTSPFFIW